ncbi:VanZ family protein [Mucilaginibacter oryzae]|uniref:VanZ family protein n=1 Tax=Mucilaginibacter oryzae TaxID=468058 RepID=A0A316H4R4_9SPHI|nr:VanZ family protein [Mucilaginibacter oryzae]PWK75914.1 VanZ family protein [Mucilaginibacter oryzae]
MKPFLKYHGPAVLWALFVLYICAADLSSVDKSPLFFEGFDKLTHCGLFFTMTVLLCFGIIRQQKPHGFTFIKAVVVLAASIFFGALIEVLQAEIFTWRTADWNDLFCDVLGSCMAVFAVMLTVWAIGYEKK